MSWMTVGIDGSGGSERALDWAATEANAVGCDLEIVHAIEIPDPTGLYSPARISPVGVAELRKFSHALLRAAEQRAAQLAPGIHVTARSRTGTPTAVLVHESHTAAAIVVGSRGLGAFEGLLGSVSTKVAVRATCPVFVIPDHGEPAIPGGPIVVGVDDSECSVQALRFALAEARLRGTSVRAVTAYQLPMVSVPLEPGVITSFEQDAHDHAVGLIEKAADRARTSATEDIKIESVVVEGPAVEAILAYAQDAQLIVVGSHRRGVVGQLVLGSTSRLLLHETSRPVAVVHPDR